MIKSYKVAGHVFSLEMPDGSPAWAMLSQYDPFEIPSGEGALFKVRLVDSLPELDPVAVYDVEPEKGEPLVRLYRSGSLWYAEMAVVSEMPVCAKMVASEDFSDAQLLLLKGGHEAQFGINNAMMLLYAFCTACLGTLEMHSSVVCKDGKGYMFLGKSGAGKSTHSRQWLKYLPGTHLVNDDNPIVRVGEDGTVRVYGSPWSGKTPCYRNEEYPAGAFVRIRQSPENKISRLGIVETYALVYSSSSGFKADPKMADGLHETLEKVVLSVPGYVLDCRPDEEAAIVCSERVTKGEAADE